MNRKNMRVMNFPLAFSPRRGAVLGAACALALTLTLTGCASLQTAYAPPPLAVPGNWSSQPAAAPADAAAEPAQAAQWWTALGDAQLNQLISQALQHSPDMALAAWNIRQAQLALGLAQDKARPSLGASASLGASRDFDAARSGQSHSLGLNLSYELDWWGKLASQRDAAQWRHSATQQDRRSTALVLVASVATLYWQLAHQNEQIASGARSLDYARRTQALVQAQYEAGGVSGLERQQAARSVAAQQAALAALQQARASTRHALAVLLGQPPTGDALAALLPDGEPQALPAGELPELPLQLPAQVLARRPDVQAAEARLRATLADGDALRASYYPSISLTAGLGSSAQSLGQWLSNPVGTLGASLALPFLRQREMRLNSEVAHANYEAAAVGFQKTLLQALQEVEDALAARQQLQQQRHWLQQQRDAALQVESLSEVRYRNGAVALQAWLDAQEARRSAELALSANRQAQLNNLLTLYKALGGAPSEP
ncbi:efflux transporter outer membrane subunit [Vandammella animalimorsus]|uniref:efflux transporter outer membrane subunit n=1 Tax=Vandammella animalimorsus TaxID=2029117 RepID=UPI0031BB62DB